MGHKIYPRERSQLIEINANIQGSLPYNFRFISTINTQSHGPHIMSLAFDQPISTKNIHCESLNSDVDA